jgi:hypothetical protein
MNRNLVNDRLTMAQIKRMQKANKYAQAIAHGGWGKIAKTEYLEKYPEAKSK